MISNDSESGAGESVNPRFTLPLGQHDDLAFTKSHLEAGAASNMVYI